MNVALIIAGGTGQRMNQDIPKQFLNVYDKPVIVYTMETFQKHPDIDAIVVVCIEGWKDILKAYSKQFSIDKLRAVVDGGETGQESIRKGLEAIRNKGFLDDDIVLVHDAIRPLVTLDIVSSSIATCKTHGSAITAIPCNEAMLYSIDKETSNISVNRDELLRTQTPQTFTLGKLLWAHEMAREKGITNSVASCTLMIELGETLFMSRGSEKNIKLTTIDDIEIFKALLPRQSGEWLKK